MIDLTKCEHGTSLREPCEPCGRIDQRPPPELTQGQVEEWAKMTARLDELENECEYLKSENGGLRMAIQRSENDYDAEMTRANQLATELRKLKRDSSQRQSDKGN